MIKKNLLKKNDAVSGVIEALLLVALVATILAIIQTMYIPEIMNQRELEHMDEVEKQFSNLKATIDIQSITQEDAPVVSVVTLGSKELPYFVTVRSTGFMRVINQSYYNITVSPMPGLEYDGAYQTVFPLSSICYESNNYYMFDETYVLEGGMFVVTDSNGENVKIKPDFEVAENDTSYLRLRLRIPVFQSLQGKEESPAGDYGPCYLRTSFSSLETFSSLPPDNLTSIKIFTDYVDSWNISLNDILSDEIKNGYITVTLNDSTSQSFIEIEPNSRDVYLNLELSYIDTQIGPGVVKH